MFQDELLDLKDIQHYLDLHPRREPAGSSRLIQVKEAEDVMPVLQLASF